MRSVISAAGLVFLIIFAAGLQEDHDILKRQDQEETAIPRACFTASDISANAAQGDVSSQVCNEDFPESESKHVTVTICGGSPCDHTVHKESQAKGVTTIDPGAGDGVHTHEDPGCSSIAEEDPTVPHDIAEGSSLSARQAGETRTPEAAPELVPVDEQRNFALLKDGAKVIQANKEASKLKALLDSDGDTYVKNDCKADKWFLVELSQVAKINQVEIWQDELYSSRVKTWEVRGRQSRPRVDGVELSKSFNSSSWKLLGSLTAENKKGSQRFQLDQPLWVRYLLIQMLSHYGSEPMCAINGFAAYGKSAAEEFEDHLASEEEHLQLLQHALDHPRLAPQEGGGAAGTEETPEGLPAPRIEGAATVAEGRQEHGEGSGDHNVSLQQQQNGAVLPTQAVLARSGSAAEGNAPQGEQPGCADVDGSCPEAGAEPPTPSPPCDAPPAQQKEGHPRGDGTPPAPAPDDSTKEGASRASDPEAQQVPLQLPQAGPDVTQAGLEAGGANWAREATAPQQAEAAGGSSQAPGAPAAQQAEPAAPGANTSAVASAAEPGEQGHPLPAPSHAAESAAPAEQQPAASEVPPSRSHQQQLSAAASAAAAAASDIDDLASIMGLAPKPKVGASVYDILLQEIKVAKLQQKLTSKTVLELQRNMSAQHAELTAETFSLAAHIAKVQKDLNGSEGAILSAVSSLMDLRLQQLNRAVLGLQLESEASSRRELVLLCLLSVLSATVAALVPGRALGAAWVKWALAALALGNGVLGLVLQWRGRGSLGQAIAALPA